MTSTNKSDNEIYWSSFTTLDVKQTMNYNKCVWGKGGKGGGCWRCYTGVLVLMYVNCSFARNNLNGIEELNQ